MAKRGREAVAKRARELRRQQQKETKRERREAAAERGVVLDPADEAALLEQFAALGEKFEANLMAESDYLVARHRILVELGIETDEDE